MGHNTDQGSMTLYLLNSGLVLVFFSFEVNLCERNPRSTP